MKKWLYGGGSVVLVAGLTLLLVREHKRVHRLDHERAELCYRQLLSLETLSTDRSDLRNRFAYHYLDQSLSKVCLGTEFPVKTSDASWCWIMSAKDDHCYDDVLDQLFSLYRDKWGKR
jgi:hypothetical protein